jgi:spermidine synthase
LRTATQFTHAHACQYVDAYELDPAIIDLSTNNPPTFHYYQSAQKRGVNAKIIPGDARRKLSTPGRERFYHVIFVDAFNSDAIPVHLLTQEAVEIYFQNLAPDGVVCFHT